MTNREKGFFLLGQHLSLVRHHELGTVPGRDDLRRIQRWAEMMGLFLDFMGPLMAEATQFFDELPKNKTNCLSSVRLD